MRGRLSILPGRSATCAKKKTISHCACIKRWVSEFAKLNPALGPLFGDADEGEEEEISVDLEDDEVEVGRFDDAEMEEMREDLDLPPRYARSFSAMLEMPND